MSAGKREGGKITNISGNDEKVRDRNRRRRTCRRRTKSIDKKCPFRPEEEKEEEKKEKKKKKRRKKKKKEEEDREKALASD